jgi:hypothetical protein
MSFSVIPARWRAKFSTSLATAAKSGRVFTLALAQMRFSPSKINALVDFAPISIPATKVMLSPQIKASA